MLSIGKLARGQADYYLSAVAQGAEDYYLGAGEAPGRWCGSGTSELDLEGEVLGDDLRTVLEGRSPSTERRLVRGNRKLPGFDCTFSAPKSVSIVHALGGEVERAAISEAHDAAVDAALGYLQRQAAFGRRGRDGVHRVESSGFVAAAFRHRTSRASDPHLHTHVLVANKELGYTAMSRGKKRNQLYVMGRESERDDPGGHAGTTHDGFDLVAALRRSEAKQLATSLTPDGSVGIEL